MEAFVEGKITEEELERNLEAETEVTEAAVGLEVKEAGGLELSVLRFT